MVVPSVIACSFASCLLARLLRLSLFSFILSASSPLLFSGMPSTNASSWHRLTSLVASGTILELFFIEEQSQIRHQSILSTLNIQGDVAQVFKNCVSHASCQGVSELESQEVRPSAPKALTMDSAWHDLLRWCLDLHAHIGLQERG